MYVQVAEKWLDSEPGEDPVQKEFLEKALHVYEELAREEGDNPDLREATARANFRTGQIYYKLARETVFLEKAEKAYSRALPVQEELMRRSPNNVEYRQELARTENALGELLRTMRRPRDALPFYERALELQAALVAATDNPAYRKEEARTSANRGLARQLVNQPDDALKDFDHAIALLVPPARDHQEDPSYAQELARVLNSRGSLLRVRRRTDAAEADYREAIRIQTDLKKRFGRKPDYRLDLAVSLNNLANLLGAKRPWWGGRRHFEAEALGANDDARELLERLSTDYQGRPRYRREWANAFNSRAALLVGTDVDGAADAWERSAKLFDELSCQADDVPDYHAGAGLALGNLGWLELDRRGRPALARPVLERAAAHLERAVAANEGNQFYRRVLDFVYYYLAEACWLLGDDAGTAEVLRKWEAQ
jgi:tetratricopeptide (TPR) repeat protein